jgi:hypothetical protein
MLLFIIKHLIIPPTLFIDVGYQTIHLSDS